MKVVQLDLPLPPSANVIWRVNRRTGKPYLNPIYTKWKKTALNAMWPQKPAGGWAYFPEAFNVHIALPIKLRIDPDNVWKPLLDFLQKPAGIIANDKHSQGASQSRATDVPKGMCRVFIYEAQAAHPCPSLPLSPAPAPARAA